ncbi:hypothetical protein GOP47_0022782 [Adiantum capillus-veneris]|uniref:Thioredoxin domain-containing protein n=1 Tax=Adiantum capillus-veneris TaxID=13818 RepID=A0A9D4Z4L9_ADICA|nr:hypothetical protein GOP47_0022782 [Adiantum capillus-veneris]
MYTDNCMEEPLDRSRARGGASSPSTQTLKASSESSRLLKLDRAERKVTPAQLWKASSRTSTCRCELGPAEKETTSQSELNADEALLKVAEDCCNTNDTEPKNVVSSLEAPTKTTNRLIALASACAAVGLFLATRGGLSGATLGELAVAALPYEEALSNGRPTVLEFYADWCEVCKEMAPDVYKVEQQYKDVVNFVMLNVDNTKWEQELDEFGVEALSKGEEKLPHSRIVGQFSNPELHQSSRMAGPRSHGTT